MCASVKQKGFVVKNTKPKVSVLTPIYNTNPIFLREMIKSIQNQTFTDFVFLTKKNNPNTHFRLHSFGIPLLKIKNNKIYLFECVSIFKVLWR